MIAMLGVMGCRWVKDRTMGPGLRASARPNRSLSKGHSTQFHRVQKKVILNKTMVYRTKQVKYPIPSPFARYKGESDDSFHDRLRVEFKEFLDNYGDNMAIRHPSEARQKPIRRLSNSHLTPR